MRGMDELTITRGEDLSLLLESLPWPAILIDADGKIISVNGPMRARLPAPLPAGSLRALFPEYHAALGDDAGRGGAREAEVVRQQPEGAIFERLWLRRLPNGASVIHVQDNTRLRHLEATQAQTARLASLGFMVASVCHEVSNPLAAVYSMVQILRTNRRLSPEMLEKGLANIATNVKRIVDLSRRLVGYSRVGDEPRTAFRLSDAIDEAFAVLREDHHLTAVTVDYAPDSRAMVFGNQGQMEEVFYNLFLNAVQAMEECGQLGVATHYPAPGQVEVSVCDSGPGIPPQSLARLFEPFFTTKPAGQGTGLGLAISQEIVQEHGGTLRAESDGTTGACFYVQLPLHEDQP